MLCHIHFLFRFPWGDPVEPSGQVSLFLLKGQYTLQLRKAKWTHPRVQHQVSDVAKKKPQGPQMPAPSVPLSLQNR